VVSEQGHINQAVCQESVRAVQNEYMLRKSEDNHRVEHQVQSLQHEHELQLQSCIPHSYQGTSPALADPGSVGVYTHTHEGSAHTSHTSPLTIKHILSCISPLTLPENLHPVIESQMNSVRFSLDNVVPQSEHITAQSHTSNCPSANDGALSSLQGQVEETDTPGQVQISASLLQNLLQGISYPQPQGSAHSQQSVPLPSIHHFASQSVQSLIQSLTSTLNAAPGANQVPNCNVSNAQHPVSITQTVGTVNASPGYQHVLSNAQPVVSQFQLPSSHFAANTALFSPLQNQHEQQQYLQQQQQQQQQHQHLQSLVQSVQNIGKICGTKGSVPVGTFSPANVQLSTSNSSNVLNAVQQQVHASNQQGLTQLVNDGAQPIRGGQIRLLLQPSASGQPQLIPLDRGLDMAFLKEIIEKNTAHPPHPTSNLLYTFLLSTGPINLIQKWFCYIYILLLH